MLHNFGIGWRDLFEKHIDYAITSLPETSVSKIERYRGMLRIEFKASNAHLQYILDSFSYKIERESARTCEKCGAYGLRRFDDLLQETMCMCLPCYTLTVDEILNKTE